MIDCEQFSGRRKEICLGYDIYGESIGMEDRKRFEYLKRWLKDNTEQEIKDFLKSQKKIETKSRGVGDVVAKVIKAATFGKVTPCNKCRQRQEKLNKIFPFYSNNNLEKIELEDSCKKNLLMHIWPTKGNNAWRWNCDRIKKRIDLFNGKRAIGIAYDDKTESPEVVKEYMKGYVDDFVIVKNNPFKREGTTFTELLEKVESKDKNEITFFCQAKGVRHGGNFENNEFTLHLWTDAMYRICLDNWNSVKNNLKDFAMTGSFRRFGQFKTPGNNQWHYSGSFYWFRNKDVFERNWRNLDNMIFAVESWPGLMFKADETGCLLFDNIGDLYSVDYWKSEIQPKLVELGINYEA